MAITNIEYALLSRFRDAGFIPQSPSILELGQSNWYGDVPIATLADDVRKNVVSESEANELIGRLDRLSKDQPRNWLFGVADVFWQTFLGPHTYSAIDLHGIDDRVHKFDLNEPVPLDQQFDIVCNFGTAEHVFNVYQVFKTMHDVTKDEGWMLHGLPFQGWVDHGFYNFQPTFFFDLAEANNYAPRIFLYAETSPPKVVSVDSRATILGMAERDEIGPNAMLYTGLQKRGGDQPFKPPVQGYYGHRLDKDSAERWKTLR
ncbi:MAG: hypothetical protein GKS03_02485 [Alphaproteobacteria bacterium]|nr:hypothetical protein [Alphaproteobacteria bacterium]